MAMAGGFQIVDEDEADAGPALLRQPHISSGSIADRPAGPFDVASSPGAVSTAKDTLITGLLVIYPALATVAAILVGLALTRGA